MSAVAAVIEKVLPADYVIVSSGDNGEFLTFATVALIYLGETIEIEEFVGSSEFPGEDALAQAHSYGASWAESENYTIEERLGPFGIEWEREQDERRGF